MYCFVLNVGHLRGVGAEIGKNLVVVAAMNQTYLVKELIDLKHV